MDKTVGEEDPSGVNSRWEVEVMGVDGDTSLSPEECVGENERRHD